MLEVAIPALWSTVHGWFTPAVLFLVLNIVIGTIAVTSKVASAAAAGTGEGAAAGAEAGAGAGGERRSLSRVPSMALDRLRSFKLSRQAAPAPEPAVTGVFADLGSEELLPPPLEAEHEQAHIERSMSEAAAEPELPRLPARLRKSASDKSAFAHFVAEEDVEAVEARAAARWCPRSPCRRRSPRRPPAAAAARWTPAPTNSSTSSTTSSSCSASTPSRATGIRSAAARTPSSSRRANPQGPGQMREETRGGRR